MELQKITFHWPTMVSIVAVALAATAAWTALGKDVIQNTSDVEDHEIRIRAVESIDSKLDQIIKLVE